MNRAGSGKRVTIKQVADRAGVSVSAVSKVMRDAYGVSPSLHARVVAAIDDLQYRPLASARGLRGSTRSVGVILPDIRNPFFAEILNGVAEVLRIAQHQMILGVKEASGGEQAVIDSVLDRQVDGIVLIGTEMNEEGIELLGSRIPLVTIGHHSSSELTGFDTVNNDDVVGARLAVRHLVANGFHDISMLSLAGTRSSSILQRERGYRLEMVASDLGKRILIQSAATSEDIRRIARTVPSSLSNRPAVFCWCDLAGFHFISATLQAGLSVPGDIGVVGYDDSELCELSQLKLTSVHQAGAELGGQAASLLLQRVAGRSEARHVLVEPWIAVRGSTMTAGDVSCGSSGEQSAHRYPSPFGIQPGSENEDQRH